MKTIAVSILIALFMIAGPIVSLAGFPQDMKPAMAKSDTSMMKSSKGMKKSSMKEMKTKKSSKAMKMKKTSKTMKMKKSMKSSKSDTTKMH